MPKADERFESIRHLERADWELADIVHDAVNFGTSPNPDEQVRGHMRARAAMNHIQERPRLQNLIANMPDEHRNEFVQIIDVASTAAPTRPSRFAK